jgi:DnaJ family protein C protein 19
MTDTDPSSQRHQSYHLTMSSAVAVGLGLLGAGLGSRVLWQAYRARSGMLAGADKFVKGGFQARMDRSEAQKILGLK